MSQHIRDFERRAKEERAAASKATDPNVARTHLDLASKYDALIHQYRELENIRPDDGGTTA